ncbi:hypothetical protein RIF29_39532 [Crotalaria pallida]|uniref:Uncharacterized protein n=1 Tax=Crotalaria pallida TaxID=3830 RepID=A0AAN9E318_CROPI
MQYDILVSIFAPFYFIMLTKVAMSNLLWYNMGACFPLFLHSFLLVVFSCWNCVSHEFTITKMLQQPQLKRGKFHLQVPPNILGENKDDKDE